MNDPILFINSVSDKKEGTSNQDYYDSRENDINKKKLVKHRIDDIKAMSFFNISIYVKVKTKVDNYEGIFNNVDEEYLYLINKNAINKICIDDIEDIVVRKR